MKEPRQPRSALCLALALIVAAAVPVASQSSDTLAAARELYSGASYEEALAMLNRLRAPGGAEEVRGIEQYRALCLLALGRSAEAQRAIEVVVAAAPSFQPSETEASPRVRTAFSEVRRRMLPSIIQQEYARARAAFDRRDFTTAIDSFQRVTEMLADPDVGQAANQPPLSDLRTLAAGFRELSISSAPPPPLPTVATGVPAPPPVVPPVIPRRSTAPRIYGGEDSNVVPPGVLRQALPPYPSRPMTAMQGALAVVISETGLVESAVMLIPVLPAYDRLIVDSAKNWRYVPATLDGTPVKYRRIVQIRVAPPGK